MLELIFIKYNLNLFNFKLILTILKTNIILHFSFLRNYYSRNELIWVDGFLLDFLQKKSVDIWIRKFVIYTGFLFSERLVFEWLIKIYLDNVIWPMHYISMLEVNNTIEMLSTTIFLYFFSFSVFSLILLMF